MEEVIELLLNEGNGISYILKNLSSKIINDDEEMHLDMNRNCLWKRASTDILSLKKNLIVSFRGEEGEPFAMNFLLMQ